MATNKRPRKAYKRIGFEDRKKIEATMYRELARGGEPYKAEVAQHSI